MLSSKQLSWQTKKKKGLIRCIERTALSGLGLLYAVSCMVLVFVNSFRSLTTWEVVTLKLFIACGFQTVSLKSATGQHFIVSSVLNTINLCSYAPYT